MLPALRLAATRPFLTIARCYGGHGHGMTLKQQCEDRGALMDLLPTPQGDFQTKYNERNRKYNMHLIAASLFLAAGLYTSYAVGAHTSPSWNLPANYNIYEVMKQIEEEAADE